MSWVTFTSRPAFDAYNQAACTAHGIPRPGYLASDNKTVKINNQWTLAWVDPFGVYTSLGITYILVSVPDADVATFGLTLAPSTPNIPFSGQRTIVADGGTRTIFTTAAASLQPKPATWTDPKTGTVYQVTP